MPAKRPPQPTDELPSGNIVQESPDDWQWETTQDESPTRVIFNEVGDVFVGQYIGVEHIDARKRTDEPTDDDEDKVFDLFIFRARDGKPYAINQSGRLITAMEKVQVGDWVRISYIKDIPTNRKLNPLKDFRVEVRSNKPLTSE